MSRVVGGDWEVLHRSGAERYGGPLPTQDHAFGAMESRRHQPCLSMQMPGWQILVLGFLTAASLPKLVTAARRATVVGL